MADVFKQRCNEVATQLSHILACIPPRIRFVLSKPISTTVVAFLPQSDPFVAVDRMSALNTDGDASGISRTNEIHAMGDDHPADSKSGTSDGKAANEEPMNGSSANEVPKQFYLLTHPRSASNLLVQILNLKEQNHLVTGDHQGGYYFMPLIQKMDDANVWAKHIDTWTLEQQNTILSFAKQCYADFAKDISRLDSEPGKTTIFVKEHADFLWSPVEHTKSFAKPKDVRSEVWVLDGGSQSEDNGTLLSDQFLLKWMPTILVRHPALAFPSHFRATKDLGWGTCENVEDDEGLAMQCSLTSSRKLYNFFDEKLPENMKLYGGIDWPVVLTGDTVMTEPEVVKRYASLIRLDVNQLRFQWDRLPEKGVEKLDKGNARMLSTLIASTGIDKSKISEAIDIDVEVQKWRREFGDRAAEKIEDWVRAAMPDYEYLSARRLRAEPTVVDGRRV